MSDWELPQEYRNLFLILDNAPLEHKKESVLAACIFWIGIILRNIDEVRASHSDDFSDQVNLYLSQLRDALTAWVGTDDIDVDWILRRMRSLSIPAHRIAS